MVKRERKMKGYWGEVDINGKFHPYEASLGFEDGVGAGDMLSEGQLYYGCTDLQRKLIFLA